MSFCPHRFVYLSFLSFFLSIFPLSSLLYLLYSISPSSFFLSSFSLIPSFIPCFLHCLLSFFLSFFLFFLPSLPSFIPSFINSVPSFFLFFSLPYPTSFSPSLLILSIILSSLLPFHPSFLTFFFHSYFIPDFQWLPFCTCWNMTCNIHAFIVRFDLTATLLSRIAVINSPVVHNVCLFTLFVT